MRVRFHAVDLEGLEAAVEVGEGHVGDGAGGAGDHLGGSARGILLLRLEGIGHLRAGQDDVLERGARAGTGSAVDDRDRSVGAADLAPVGDLAREDLLQVLELDVVDGHVGVDDRGHADDAHLVIGDLGDVGGILQLVFDEEGNLEFRTACNEDDLLYDDIGSGLKIKQLQQDKKELLESLEMYYKVFFLGDIPEEELKKTSGSED